MTVRELIEKLQALDADLPVFVRGYEGGVDDVTALESVTVVRDYYDEWYYGAHEVIIGAEDLTEGERTPGVQLIGG